MDVYDGIQGVINIDDEDEYEEFLREQADFDALVESEKISRINFEEK